MSESIEKKSHDDISEKIKSTAGTTTPPSPEELAEALSKMAREFDT